ncbi:hypothetical protein KFU94_44870 [Chloroflexi bacterium TSY]|nr:hypothetical protein [Chloroflexi bacterium TSY]
MARQNKAKSGIFDRLANEAIILVGDPTSLRTEIMLVNPGQERLVLKEAQLSLRPVDEDQPSPMVAVSLSGTIPPGGMQRIRLSVEMDPYTTPGEYQGELETAGTSRPVVVHVVEVYRLELQPLSVVIDANAGESVTKQIIFRNQGNVPLTIGQPGRVALGQEVMLPRSLMGSVAPVDVQQERLRSLFAEVIDVGSSVIVKEARFLEVQNPSVPIDLSPGEVRAIPFKLTLPKQLEPNSRYLARLPFYNATLEFVVTPVNRE